VPATITLEATEQNGVVTASFPKNTPYDQNRFYTVRLLTTQPKLTSPPEGSIRLWPEPAAELITASRTMDFKSFTNLDVRFRGAPPYRAELTDGLRVSTIEAFSQPVTGSVSFQVQKTTDYRIVSFSTGCGGPARAGQNTTRFEVLPGIVIDSLPGASNVEVCEGQTIGVRLRSNLPVSGGTTYTVRLRQFRTLPGGWLPVEWSVPARLEGTRLVFTLPLVGETVNDLPTASLMPGNGTIVAGDTWYPSVSQFTGGGPYTFVLTDGTRDQTFFSPGGTPGLSPERTTTYRLKSVSIVCGTRTISGGTSITVRVETLRVYSLNFPGQVCTGAPVSVTASMLGQARPDTRFSLSLIEANDTTKTVALIAEGVGGRMDGTVPATVAPGTYVLKLVTASPTQVEHLTK